MKIIKVYIGMVALIASSCATGSQRWTQDIKDFTQTSDKDIAIQAAKLPYEPHDSLALNFRIRIKLNKEVPNLGQLNQNQFYRMDSCFYLQMGKRKLYPELIQAVAAGVSKRYEYLVSFNAVQLMGQNEINLVYHDRYINKKNYTMLLK